MEKKNQTQKDSFLSLMVGENSFQNTKFQKGKHSVSTSFLRHMIQPHMDRQIQNASISVWMQHWEGKKKSQNLPAFDGN